VKETSPPVIFARIDRQVNDLQLQGALAERHCPWDASELDVVAEPGVNLMPLLL